MPAGLTTQRVRWEHPSLTHNSQPKLSTIAALPFQTTMGSGIALTLSRCLLALPISRSVNGTRFHTQRATRHVKTIRLAVIWMKGRCAMATLALARRTHAQAPGTRSSHRLALLRLQHQLWLPCSERGPCSREGVWIN